MDGYEDALGLPYLVKPEQLRALERSKKPPGFAVPALPGRFQAHHGPCGERDGVSAKRAVRKEVLLFSKQGMSELEVYTSAVSPSAPCCRHGL